MSFHSDNPIGLFDSGVGGLTIMKEVVKHLPQENIVYFGDTARLPYGNKSPQSILRYTLDNVSFLLDQKIKILIIACFTASSHTMETLEQKLSIPVIGVIQSGFKSLMDASSSKKVAILGTSSTIKSGVLQRLIFKQDPSAIVYPIACPLLAPLIEEGLADHPAARMIVEHYLQPLKETDIDAALLACTHYPLIRHGIQEVLGPSVQLVQPAECCALQTKELLASEGLLNQKKSKPVYEFFASDDPEKFRSLARHFLGEEVKEVRAFLD